LKARRAGRDLACDTRAVIGPPKGCLVSAESSVRQTLTDFVRAFEQGDIDALSDTFVHDDALLFFGTHDKLHFTRWSDVEGSFRKQFTVLKDIECRITEDVHVRLLAGGAAACAGTAGFAVRAVMGDVRFDMPALRLTCTLERQPERHEDRWRIVQLHLSASDTQFLERVNHVIVKYF
jgi:ketosteroid isomerase-like protein